MLAILQSTRPRTLVLSVSSILTGTFLAREQGFFSWPLFIFLMLTSCLLQILSNLVNEYGDWKKGTDKEQPGRRALSLQSGKMTERQIITFIYIIGGLSLISGLALVRLSFGTLLGYGPFVFLFLGAVALAAAIFYSAGKIPYGYHGGGDLAVFLFFGPAGVAGSFYLLSGYLDRNVFLIATAVGLLITAVLNVNNIRDYENDKSFGKKTFAVLLSRFFKTESDIPAKIYQLVLIVLALVLSCFYAVLSVTGSFTFFVSLPFLAVHLVWIRYKKGAALDGALKILIVAILVYAVSFL